LLGHLRRREWRQAAEHCDLRFLVTLFCGILLGIGGLSTVMHSLLENHKQATYAGFFGLILASSIVVAQSIERWSVLKVILALLGAAFAFWLVAQTRMDGVDTYEYLFLCGMVAICAMILPGISGAFILVIMGKYEFVTGKIHDLAHGVVTAEHVMVLAVFASGCAVGLLSFSKFLRWLLARYHGHTLAVLFGFMLGSLRKIWPYKETFKIEGSDDEHWRNILPEAFDGQVAFHLGLAIGAIAFVLVLDWVVRRHAAKKAD